MRKRLFTLFLISIIVALSCNKEKDMIDYAQDITGSYKGNMSINIPGLEETIELQKIILSSSSFNQVDLALNSFSYPVGGQSVDLGDIIINNVNVQRSAGDLIYIIPTTSDVNLNFVGDVKVTVGGIISGNAIDLTIDIAETGVGNIKVLFNGEKMDIDNERMESLIVSMSFGDAVVTAQPVINDINITFYVNDTAKTEDLIELTPTIVISDGATIDPPSGEAQDFSQGAVQYIVTAEDGIHKTTYNVSYLTGRFDFENWMDVSYNVGNQTLYCQEATGWTSSNAGAAFIHVMLNFTGIPVIAAENARSGKYAAKIETFNTSGNPLIPFVSVGTLFTGSFELNLNMLNSTKFGVPYNKKPTKITGWYKYTPGRYYYVSETGRPSNASIDPTMVDSCSIIAVLYEVDNLDTDFLTGENLHTSDKIVMRAELEDRSMKEDWTFFELDFETINNKIYSPSKLYKLAIVCSSSRNGDKFNGAPGSVLMVDDFEIIASE